MGLPGSGKTTLADALSRALDAAWLNADALRRAFDDWDFSEEGRLRQSTRMAALANLSCKQYIVADFVAALSQQREIFSPDFVIWMNTITSGRYGDTNEAFQPPTSCDIQFNSFEEVSLEKVLIAIEDRKL